MTKVKKVTKALLKEIGEGGRVDANNCAIGVRLIRPDDLRRAIETRDISVAKYVPQINEWLANMKKAKPGEGPLCLDCDTEFSISELPHGGFIVIGSGKQIILTAICTSCGKQSNEELIKIGAAHVKTMWRDARVPPDVAARADELIKKGDWK